MVLVSEGVVVGSVVVDGGVVLVVVVVGFDEEDELLELLVLRVVLLVVPPVLLVVVVVVLPDGEMIVVVVVPSGLRTVTTMSPDGVVLVVVVGRSSADAAPLTLTCVRSGLALPGTRFGPSCGSDGARSNCWVPSAGAFALGSALPARSAMPANAVAVISPLASSAR